MGYTTYAYTHAFQIHPSKFNTQFFSNIYTYFNIQLGQFICRESCTCTLYTTREMIDLVLAIFAYYFKILSSADFC